MTRHYRERDSHEAFFRPGLKPIAVKIRRKRNKKTDRPLSDEKRTTVARDYWVRHHQPIHHTGFINPDVSLGRAGTDTRLSDGPPCYYVVATCRLHQQSQHRHQSPIPVAPSLDLTTLPPPYTQHPQMWSPTISISSPITTVHDSETWSPVITSSPIPVHDNSLWSSDIRQHQVP